jgi:cobalt-zinc-cadmium efflux system outer membrane protein
MRPTWLLALLATLAGSAHAAPMTFEAALKLADQSAPNLEARAADVRAARLAAVAAGRLPDPKLAFGVEGFPISGPDAGHPERNDFSDVRVGVMQDVPNGAKRRAARDRATADIGAAEVGGAAEGRNVRLSTALAWIDLYYAEQRLATLDDVSRALAPLRGTAASRLASGAARPGETLQPEQWTAALADRRAALVANLAKARAELVRWTGQLEPEVAGSPPDYTIDPVALRAGLDDLPALRVYDARGRQAAADVAAAKADKRPDTSWELAYQRRDPRFGDMVMAQVTVSLPLFASTRQDPIIAARAQTAARVRTEREGARRELLAALDSSLADHVMHHEQLMRASDTLVPLAKQRADLESASYAAGTASLSDVLSALLAFAEARTDVVDRQADAARDAVRIALTFGAQAQ